MTARGDRVATVMCNRDTERALARMGRDVHS